MSLPKTSVCFPTTGCVVFYCLAAHGVKYCDTVCDKRFPHRPGQFWDQRCSYAALSAVSKVFMMPTGQQHAPRGCDHRKEQLVCVQNTVKQISTHRLGQGVEVGSFVQKHVGSKSFLGMFSKKKQSCFLTWQALHLFFFMSLENPLVLTQRLEGVIEMRSFCVAWIFREIIWFFVSDTIFLLNAKRFF